MFRLPVALIILTILTAGEAYQVGVGDVLSVKVFGEPELKQDCPVSDDGTILLPWLRRVPVAGLTLRRIESKLEELLAEGYLISPQVSVSVKVYKSKFIYVLGAVKNPGPYSLTGQTTILQAIAGAGGITDQGGRVFTLIRGGAKLKSADIKKVMADAGEPGGSKKESGTQVIHIDGHKLLDLGDLSWNLSLEDGDILSIQKSRQVYLDGEVKKPGPVPFEEGLTVLRAVALAGGLTPSASKKAVITRDKDGRGERIVVNLRKLAEDPSKDFPLKAGDIIRVKRRFF